MTFIDNFSKLNMGNFMSGWNNWFSPTFSCDFMPSFFDLNIFSSGFNNWSFPSFGNFSMPSLFNFTPMNNFDFSFNNNIWDNSWNNSASIMPDYSRLNTGIGDNFSLSNKPKTSFSISDYNAQAGKRLANYALSHAKGSSGNCARYVKTAIAKTGLGAYQSGHGYQVASILRNNSNFKEISPNSVNVKDLPAGCVIVFNRNSQGYDKNYGHVEITTGDGRGVSDGITTKLKKPDAIFVPV